VKHIVLDIKESIITVVHDKRAYCIAPSLVAYHFICMVSTMMVGSQSMHGHQRSGASSHGPSEVQKS
jgi:hypothetical protein